MDNICYIFGAGERSPKSITLSPDDLVIAADGGFDYLEEIGLRADIVLGDFDSVISYDLPSDAIRYPRDKDDTDMMLAIKLGLSKGYKEFIIFGGLGGRLDHSLGNIQLLLYLSKNGATGTLYAKDYAVKAVSGGSIVLGKDPVFNFAGNLCSVFALDRHCHNVTITGLKYEVSGADWYNHIPIGVSNEFTGKRAVISCTKGSIAVLWQLPPH
ncbi:MAG TPA: thiamine diphosphokinase [Lachnospiraceae bacterium]|nr:thiamine diphosphokinase [Eubacterium sp.]HAK58504.1 thiamine diphosphokinase [Lachnospiraceae bacterium]